MKPVIDVPTVDIKSNQEFKFKNETINRPFRNKKLANRPNILLRIQHSILIVGLIVGLSS